MCTILPLDRPEPVAQPKVSGCAFLLDGAGPCRAPVRSGSAYCHSHHALCHLPSGSAEERRQLREIAALAKAVGGKQGRAADGPPPLLLRRLKRIERAFSRPVCS
jgi:hypothetical protein